MWTRDEQHRLFDFWGKSKGDGEAILGLATLAVELMAARGETMTAARLAIFNARILADGLSKTEQAELLGHSEALGSTVAILQSEAERMVSLGATLITQRDSALKQVSVLQAKAEELERRERAFLAAQAHYKETVDDFRAEVERLKGWRDKCINDNNAWAARLSAAEARLAAIRETVADVSDTLLPEAERLAQTSAALGKIREVLEGDAPQEAKPKGSLVIGDDGAPVRLTRDGIRYPCSPTCTHDDAATPVHPERVKERSEAFSATVVQSGEEQASDAYDHGAEAMRAACWEAVEKVLESLGWAASDGHLRNQLKTAIEGAAP